MKPENVGKYARKMMLAGAKTPEMRGFLTFLLPNIDVQ